MKTTLHLTGAYAGQTIKLGSHQFVEGKCVLEGNGVDVDSALKVLGRSYQAFPAGSDELVAAQSRDSKVKGPTNVNVSSSPADGKPGNPASLVGDHEPARAAGSSEAAVIKPGPLLSASAGDTGLVSDGPGTEITGLQPAQVKKIKDALALLDPGVDAHWSEAGLPSIEMLVDITKDQTINRAAVSFVAPELNRVAAQTAKDIASL